MAGWGTGVPLCFACAKCRKQRGWKMPRGRDVVRTGRTKKLTGRAAGNQPPRSLGELHEYRCNDCGHVGWSRHHDMLRARVISDPTPRGARR